MAFVIDYSGAAADLVERGWAVLHIPYAVEPPAAPPRDDGTREDEKSTEPASPATPLAGAVDPVLRLPALLRGIRRDGLAMLDFPARPDIWPSDHFDLDRATGFAPVRKGRMNFTVRGVPLPPLLPRDALTGIARSETGVPSHGAAGVPVPTEPPTPPPSAWTADEKTIVDTVCSAHASLTAAFPLFLELGQRILQAFSVHEARKRTGSPSALGMGVDTACRLSDLVEQPPNPDGLEAAGPTMSSLTAQLYDSRALAKDAFCGHDDPGTSAAESRPAEAISVSPHIDCTVLTLVAPGTGDGCLHVMDNGKPGWTDALNDPRAAPPAVPPGVAFEPIVIMSGYLLRRALGESFYGAYLNSTLHRVVVPAGLQRSSVVMRLLPQADAELCPNELEWAEGRGARPGERCGGAEGYAPRRRTAKDEVAIFRSMCDSVNASTGSYAKAPTR